ncbi:MAG: sigma-70 family RNA polymerase sigma factor [Chloroflexi bacterium]|nr:sigma-70 family RNA polymerase sigma factor [Chloroflexota bacterium]
MRQSDESLVEEALLRPEVFAELITRYQNKVYSLACRITGDAEEAKDLAQETFIRAYTSLPGFHRGARFSPWLYRIATNLSLNYRKRRREAVPLADKPLPDETSLSPEEAVERKESQERIQRAILGLPGLYRTVLVLRHVNELTYQEIAQVLEIPVGTVKARLFRARDMLREVLRSERDGTSI